MTDFALTGKKGTGKSKNAVLIIRDEYLRRGRAVASNLDLFLEPMFGVMSRVTYVRLPDKPTAFDLQAAGHGNPGSYDEDQSGAMVLDEMSMWFNTRTFSDPRRQPLLDYFALARKFGWDVYYIMQNIVQVDKQLREAFVEQVARHRRYDKVRVPLIGGLLSLLFGERAGWLPKFHSVSFRMGVNPQDLVARSYYYKAKDIEACYDTCQLFTDSYAHGTYSVLSPWHVKGRYLPQPPASWWRRAYMAVFRKRDLRAREPVRPVDAGWARVRDMAAALAPDDALRVMARYSRLCGGLSASAIAGAEGAPRSGA